MINQKIESNLKCQIVENATIFPCQYRNGTTYSGVFDSEGRVVNDSLLFRGQHEQVIFALEKNDSSQNYLDDNYIFAGYLNGHYGHFLLESLARLWYIKKHPEIPIIWIPFMGPKQLKVWQKEIFSLLNINNKHIIIDKPSFVKKIIMPQPGYVIRDYFVMEQAQALIARKIEAPNKDRKVWLSRSQLSGKNSLGLIYNEKQLEDILESQGWIIFHAQEYTIKQQLRILSSASYIAGFEGSAFHTLIFIDQLSAIIKIFARGKHLINKNYTMIAETKKLKQTEHSVPTTKIRERTQNYGASVYLIHSYKEIIDILNNTEE